MRVEVDLTGRRALQVVIAAWLSFLAATAASRAQTNVAPAVGQSEGYTALSYSSDGRWLASGAGDGTVAIWDLESGRIIRRFTGDTKSTDTVSISPDRKSIASISGSIRIWDILSGNLQREIRDLATNRMAMSPDWQNVAADGSVFQGVKLYQVLKIATSQDGAVERTLFGHGNSITRIVYSADGKFIASGSDDKTARFWDAKTGKLLRSFSGYQGSVAAVAISPDNQRVAAGGDDKTLKVWNTATGSLERSIAGFSEKIVAVSFSPDGRFIVASSDRELAMFSTTGGQQIWRSGDEDGIYDVKFSPDGRQVALATYQNIVLRDSNSGAIVRKLEGLAESANPVLFGSAQSLISDGRVWRRWDLASGRLLSQSSEETNLSAVMAVSADGKLVATSSYEGIAIWDASSGRQLRKFDKPPEFISALVFAPDGQSLLSGGGKVVRFWSLATGRSVRSVNLTGLYSIVSMAITPDGRTVAVSLLDSIRLLDASSGRLIRSFEKRQGDAYDMLTFANDGRVLVTGGFVTCSPIAGCHGDSRIQWGALKLWDVGSGRLLRTMDDYRSRVKAVAVSPDSQTIVGVSDDGTIKMWNAASGRLLGLLHGNATTIKSIAFSQDGSRIVGGSDSEVKVWDFPSAEQLVSLVCSPGGEWATITPEGFFDASPRGAELLYVVQGFQTERIDRAYNVLYRPDLVREKLAGDPNGKVKAASAQLNLDKVVASGSAPKVSIASPEAAVSSPTDEAEVEALITDQGGGIGRIEWRVNGVTLGVETRGIRPLAGSAENGPATTTTQSLKRKLALERGENRVEIVAYNGKNLVASEAAVVTIQWDGEKTAAPPRLYVLSVGVNDYYDSRLHLTYAVPDAIALAEGFGKAGAGLYAGVEVKTVLDSDVTPDNLDRVFAELGGRIQPRDVFVFFLAGHGKTKNGRYYFLPRDFRYEDESSVERAGMDQDRFQAWFARIPARKSILLYDTCESGSLTGNNSRGSDIDERLGALNRMARATGRTFLTATTDDSPALEGYRGHGVFTYVLLDAFARADVNNNGMIEVSELADYVDRRVPDLSFEVFKLRQIPQRSIVGNNFPLASRVEVLGVGSPPNDQPDGGTTIPLKPTHVAVASADSYAQASGNGTSTGQVPAGTLLSLVRTEQNWALVAKDGKLIGYVRLDRLMQVK
jgi:WD40 repeat protein